MNKLKQLEEAREAKLELNNTVAPMFTATWQSSGQVLEFASLKQAAGYLGLAENTLRVYMSQSQNCKCFNRPNYTAQKPDVLEVRYTPQKRGPKASSLNKPKRSRGRPGRAEMYVGETEWEY